MVELTEEQLKSHTEEKKAKGLNKKYEITKLTNPTKEIDAIVLEWDDPISRKGIRTWIEELKKVGYDTLYNDVNERLKLSGD